MIPVIPHIASECLDKFQEKPEIKWPEVEKRFLVSEKNEVVIQVNGKKRSIVSIKKGASEDLIIKTIEDMKLIEKYIKDKKVFKTIYVQDKIINFIIK